MRRSRRKNAGRRIKINSSSDIISIEIRDGSRRMIYRRTFNLNDRNELGNFLFILEKYSGHSLYNILVEKANVTGFV